MVCLSRGRRETETAKEIVGGMWNSARRGHSIIMTSQPRTVFLDTGYVRELFVMPLKMIELTISWSVLVLNVLFIV